MPQEVFALAKAMHKFGVESNPEHEAEEWNESPFKHRNWWPLTSPSRLERLMLHATRRNRDAVTASRYTFSSDWLGDWVHYQERAPGTAGTSIESWRSACAWTAIEIRLKSENASAIRLICIVDYSDETWLISTLTRSRVTVRLSVGSFNV